MIDIVKFLINIPMPQLNKIEIKTIFINIFHLLV